MRGLWILLILLPVAGVAAGGPPYLGRPVAEVIDEFRDSGEPFAYSTNLVTNDLIVTREPDPGEPLDIVRQILEPHGLVVDEQSGVYLVRRFNSAGLEAGRILLVITTKDNSHPLPQAAISVVPDLTDRDRVKPGIYEFSNVAPGRYQFRIEATGFQSVRRIIDVWPGEAKIVPIGMDAARPEIETISVSASRYEILRDIAASRFVLDQRTIQNMPDIGEDPLRVVQRLPGAAASGASAKTHFRGGDESEIGIMLNGQWLFDPYHIRDYQSVFSAIDSRAIEGVEVYTGGFPVRFGNRMSGLVLMESLEALKPRHTEIGVSVFNTSFLTAGNESDRHWLVSARRGNLDLVLKEDVGEPSYYDLFTEFSYDVSPDTKISLNGLYAYDRVLVVLEPKPEELEKVVSKTRNAQFWAQLDNRWSDELSSSMVLSAVAFNNLRSGSLGDPAKIIGDVHDDRSIRQFGFRQDFMLNKNDRHLVQWGLQAVYAEGEYDYRNNAEYFSLQSLYADQEDTVSRTLAASPKGTNYSLYFADRWKISGRSVLEWGLRWDDQSYDDFSADSQLSPRLSYLRAFGNKTELRFSWGRYYQSQQINELQIEDGITNFWPAQQADHLIAGLSHLFKNDVSLRIELFEKDMRQVRPRFENLYNPLGLIPEVQPDRIRLDPDSARSHGLEISLEKSSGPLNWWATYVLSKATDRIDGRDELRSWDQRHGFQGGVSWSNEKWDVAFATSIHSGWPLTELYLVEDGVDAQGETQYVAIPGTRNTGRYPTFASLDFRISRTWKLARGSFMAFLEVSNLTNRGNQCCLDWDIEIDEVTGETLLERGVEYWPARLPAIGVLWEF